MGPRWMAALAIAALVSACGGDGDAAGDGGDEATDPDAALDSSDGSASGADAAASAGELELGSAEADGSGFLPIADAGDIPLHAGIQGSHHIWTGVRVRSLSGTVSVAREVRRASDDEVITASNTFELEVPDEAEVDWWTVPDALLHVVCPAAFDVNGVEVTVRVSLLDEDEAPILVTDKSMVPRCPDPPGTCSDDCGD